jgi:hypothetical protein
MEENKATTPQFPAPQSQRATGSNIPVPMSTYLSTVYNEGFEDSLTGMPIRTAIDFFGLDAEKEFNAGERKIINKSNAEAVAQNYGVQIEVPEEGIEYWELIKTLQQRKSRQDKQQIYDNAPDGVLRNILGTGAMVGGMATSPVDLALGLATGGFGPAMMAAKTTAGMSAAQRFAVRSAVYGAEGAAVSALIEPAVYSMARYLGDDYTIYDSFTNIAFGAAFSSGIGAGGGLIGDSLKGYGKGIVNSIPADEKAKILQAAAHEQLTTGRITIAPVVEAKLKKQLLYSTTEIFNDPKLRALVEAGRADELPMLRARESFLSTDDPIAVRINELETQLITKEKPNIFERAAEDYRNADAITDPELKARQIENIDNRYGKGFKNEVDDFEAYRAKQAQLETTTDKDKAKTLAKEIETLDAKYDGKFSRTLAESKSVDPVAVQAEIEMLRAELIRAEGQAAISMGVQMQKLMRAAEIEEKAAIEAYSLKRGNTELQEAIYNAEESVKKSKDKAGIDKTPEMELSEINEDIAGFKKEIDDFIERKGANPFDEIDDSVFDISDAIDKMKKYAGCLLR